MILFDATFAPLVKGIAAHYPCMKHWVRLSDAEHTPAFESVAKVLLYDEIVAPCSAVYEWP